MPIKNVNINPETQSDLKGINPFQMRNLSNIVLLAGKNGAGKSRILNLISNAHSFSLSLKNGRSQRQSKVDEGRNNIKKWESAIQGCNAVISNPSQDEAAKAFARSEIASNRQSIENTLFQISEDERFLSLKDPLEFDSKVETKIFHFVPKNPDFAGTSKKNLLQIDADYADSFRIGIERIQETTLPLIDVTTKRKIVATSTMTSTSAIDNSSAVENFDRLSNLIKVFLGEELKNDQDGRPMLFGKRIENANLSDGQKILLQICTAIFAQGGELNGCIILLDEPENHLHPSAVIGFVNSIIKAIPNGQIWISTHSVPLLSEFYSSDIWFVDNNSITRGGRIPGIVLKSLLGDDTQIQRLLNFVGLPAELAMIQFAMECLLQPNAIETDSEDPQVAQFCQQVRQQHDPSCQLRILDYGAGKGRLISSIFEAHKDVLSRISYYAYDKFDGDANICKKNISLVHPDDFDDRYSSDIHELKLAHSGSKDVVLLCNVLHEVPILEWEAMFRDISELLSNTGNMIIIEDCNIQKGELPNENGFLLLRQNHIRLLFDCVNQSDNIIVNDARSGVPEKSGRLMAYSIPKRLISNVSKRSIIAALEELKLDSISMIKKIRNNTSPKYADGLAHSLWLQLLANSTLALSEMEQIA